MQLNLATRPFRNETLPALLFVTGAVLLFVVTTLHVTTARRLAAGGASALNGEIESLEQESRKLREQSRDSRVALPEAAVLKEWATVKDLLDRRLFAWTDLLSRLEEALPAGVRLLALAPTLEKGDVQLQISAVARTPQDGRELIRALETRADFDDVFPVRQDEENGESTWTYILRFRPYIPRPVSTPAASPAPEPDGRGATSIAQRVPR